MSEHYAPIAAQAGCVVIDNTSRFRYDDDVPLVVPEVNAERIADYSQRGIIANPNCSTIQLVVALKPIHDRCWAVADQRGDLSIRLGWGSRCRSKTLARQTAALLNGRPLELAADNSSDRFQRGAAHRPV